MTIDKKVRAAADKLQLTNFLDRLPKALSGGQRQRVAIGRSIVRDPKVYLFDEPLSNLDAALRVATRIEIAQLKEQMPESTMIYVTHDQVEAMTLATRIVVLAGGGIAQVGSPLDALRAPRERPSWRSSSARLDEPSGRQDRRHGRRHHAGTERRRRHDHLATTPRRPRIWVRPSRSASGPRTWSSTDAENYAFMARSTSPRRSARSRSSISNAELRITRQHRDRQA
jgi:ABC-type sulfate/molybdate transport systems ATPase subunit